MRLPSVGAADRRKSLPFETARHFGRQFMSWSELRGYELALRITNSSTFFLGVLKVDRAYFEVMRVPCSVSLIVTSLVRLLSFVLVVVNDGYGVLIGW